MYSIPSFFVISALCTNIYRDQITFVLRVNFKLGFKVGCNNRTVITIFEVKWVHNSKNDYVVLDETKIKLAKHYVLDMFCFSAQNGSL